MSSQVSNGPTEQEAQAALLAGKVAYRQKTLALLDDMEDAKQDHDYHEAQCLEGAGITSDSGASTEDHSKQLARYVWTARGFFVTAWLGIVAGSALLIGGGLIAPGVELSLFIGMFRSGFENTFGEISSTGLFLTGLVAMQAVFGIFAVKFCMGDGRRTALMSGIAFIIAILLMVGAVLERAHTLNAQKLAETSTDDGLTWSPLDQAAEAIPQTLSLDAYLSSYLLSLGFILVPIVAALMFSAGWKAFSEGLTQRRAAQDYLSNHRKLRTAAKSMAASESGLRRHLESEQDIVVAPLNDLIAPVLRDAKTMQKTIDKARQSGLADFVLPTIPDDPRAKMTDLAKASTDVKAILDKYGNGFANDAYDKFNGRLGAPPNNS